MTQRISDERAVELHDLSLPLTRGANEIMELRIGALDLLADRADAKARIAELEIIIGPGDGDIAYDLARELGSARARIAELEASTAILRSSSGANARVRRRMRRADKFDCEKAANALAVKLEISRARIADLNDLLSLAQQEAVLCRTALSDVIEIAKRNSEPSLMLLAIRQCAAHALDAMPRLLEDN